MIATLLACTIPVLAAIPQDALDVQAKIRAKKLEKGESYEIVVKAKLDRGLKADGAGMPNPILQVDVPSCIKLDGKVLTDHRELAKNEFLHAPYEVMMDKNVLTIPFTLVDEPGRDDVIGISVAAYVNSKDGSEKSFIRRRVHLPVAPKSKSEFADAADSSWGTDHNYLQIGDNAADFTLPKADGTKVSLADFKGKHVIVTTYRAHW